VSVLQGELRLVKGVSARPSRWSNALGRITASVRRCSDESLGGTRSASESSDGAA